MQAISQFAAAREGNIFMTPSSAHRTNPGMPRLGVVFILLGMGALAGCQTFSGSAGGISKGILLDEAPTAVFVGMTPAQVSQARQHTVAVQIKKAGGEIVNNMALYPGSTVVAVDLNRTQAKDSDLVHLSAFPNLHTLNLHHTKISDVGIASVAKLTTLQTLHLGNTEVSDAGLEALQVLPQLHELGLTYTKVTDGGMATLGRMHSLTELSVSGSQITDKGISELKTLTHLRKLTLIKTSATKAGVERLRKALPNTHIYFS
jgi:hypothetical protein